MPDYGECYASQAENEYKGWSDEDLRRMIHNTDAEMNGLKLAKSHLELVIDERRNKLDDMSFELLRRAKATDKG